MHHKAVHAEIASIRKGTEEQKKTAELGMCRWGKVRRRKLRNP